MPVSDRVTDRVPEVPQAEHYPLNAGPPQEPQLVDDERLTIDVHQRLGDGASEWQQACRKSTCQNRYRQGLPGHDCTTTLVPAKSKRNRTSRKPAENIARRSRVLSSA